MIIVQHEIKYAYYFVILHVMVIVWSYHYVISEMDVLDII